MWSKILSCYLLVTLFRLSKSATESCKQGTVYNLSHKVCEKKLLFSDDFSSNNVYMKWRNVVRFATYPDYEFNFYDRAKENIYVKDGVLIMQPTLLAERKGEAFVRKGEIELTTYPPRQPYCSLKPDSGLCYKKAVGHQILPPVATSRVTSRFRFRYGTVEIRAKLPKGDWIYPQIELSPPAGASRYGESSGAIIIALARGNNELKINGYDERLNFGNTWLEAGVYAETYAPMKTPNVVAAFNTSGWHTDFHTFRVEWTPGELSFTVDGQPIGKGTVSTKNLLSRPRSADAPIDEELEVALGIGVGGIQRFPDGIWSGGSLKPWKNASPKAMYNFWKARNVWQKTWNKADTSLQIDSVKVWSIDAKE